MAGPKKSKPTNFDPARIARELDGHLQDAVGDIASDMLGPASGLVDDKWEARIKDARKKRIPDLHGWLADELYNDADCIRDTIGDKLYEACNGDPELENKVLDIMEENAHPGMKEACQALRKQNDEEIRAKK